jgi:hypothetical protein
MTDSERTGGRTMKFGSKLPSSFSWVLSVLVLLCGCGGGPGTSLFPSNPPSGGPPPSPPAQGISGGWQLSTTSTVGMPPLTIAGSLNESGSSVTGAVHVAGASCFDQRNVIGLTGTLTDGNVSLTSASVDGQVTTFAGGITTKANFPDTLTGTYAINGGCANGAQGDVTGYSVGAFNGSWYGNLTTAGGVDIHWGTDQLGQVSPSSEGSFGLTGTFNFDGACFNSGKLTPGTYPTPSFILGTSVVLNVPTDNGTIAFVGSAGPDEGGLIEGTYTVTGGSCESTGTGYLSPWEY